jgi:hypothetical protein
MKHPQIETVSKKTNNSTFYQEGIYFSNNQPEFFKLKALVRDEFGRLKTNSFVCIQIFISGIDPKKELIYDEIHPVITNSYGLTELSVGLENPAKFKRINWMHGPYFMQVIVNGHELMNKVLISGL